MQQHCDPEDLALLALGESVDGTCSEHAATCAECGEQLTQLREVISVGRASGGPDALVEPPSHVWRRIESQLDTEPVPMTLGATSQVNHSAEQDPAPAIPIGRKRGLPRWTGLVAATAAGILIGGAVVTVVTGQDEQASIVASAQLMPMPDGPDRGGEAQATLNRTDTGYSVTVTASGLEGPEGFYEVWLLDPQDSGLVALGTLAPGEKQAAFPVPDGIDLSAFNAVDISDEPLDGDPTHSTVTVLRGTLQT